MEERLSERPWGDSEPPLDADAHEAWAKRCAYDAHAARALDEQLRLDALLYAAHASTLPPAPAWQGNERVSEQLGIESGRRWRWLSTAGGFAALLALTLATAWLYESPGSTELITEAGTIVPAFVEDGESLWRVADGEPARMKLVDGSQAQFEPGSLMRLPAPRRVELHRGAGWFAVERGSDPFRLWTPRGEVVVLGTEFSVELRETAPREAARIGGMDMKVARTMGLALAVTVLTGQVEVRCDGEQVVLTAGESRVFAEENEGHQGDEGRAVAEANKDRQQGLRAARAALSNALGKTPAEAHPGLEAAMEALENAEEELEDAEEAAGEARGAEGRAKAREAVNRAAAKPLEALAKIAGKVPEQARASIDRAMDEVRQAKNRALKGLDEGGDAENEVENEDAGEGGRGGPPAGAGKRAGPPEGVRPGAGPQGEGGGGKRPEGAGRPAEAGRK